MINFIRNQLLIHQESQVQWDDYYGLNNEQMDVIESLYLRKMESGSNAIYINEEEIQHLCCRGFLQSGSQYLI